MAEAVEFKGFDGVAVPGVYAKPDPFGDPPFRSYAAVVLIPDEWGATESVVALAESLAETGYRTVVVDLYRGKTATNAADAAKLLAGLVHDRAIADIEAAVAFAVSQPSSGKIALYGVGTGGTLALEVATRLPKVSAVVTVEGGAPPDTVDLSRIAAQVLQQYPAKESGASERVEAIGRRIAPSRSIQLNTGIASTAGFRLRAAGDQQELAATVAWDEARDFLNNALT